MNHHITLDQCTAALDANGIGYGIFALQNGAQALVSEYGGHVLGPFIGPGGESLLWTNPALAGADALRGLVAARDWNIGGDRIWIAPEIQYNCHDRTDFWGTLDLPQQMDPGDYTLEQLGGDAWHVAQEVTLEAHNLNTGSKTLHVDASSARRPTRCAN